MIYDPLFMAIIDITIKNEGGDKITDDPQDPGGRTKYGITQKLLDHAMPGRTVDTLTEDEAKDVYYKAFWMEYHLDALGSLHPSLAFKVFDFCVTAGPDPAFRCLQRAMRANLVETKEDGVMGPITRGQLKSFLDGNESCGQACMLVAYRSECAGYYRDLDKPRFEAGWVNRAYR